MPRRSKYTIELLRPIVENSASFAAVISQLGLKRTGGNYRMIQGHIRTMGLATSHFTGARWNVGRTAADHLSVERSQSRLRHHPTDVLRAGTTHTSRVLRRSYLATSGHPYACAECGLTEWRSFPITLHLDHVNGDHTDNRIENLRWLCPNCHQQTKTWGHHKGA